MAISMWKVAVEVRFADQSITPVLPETCVEACFQPNARTPSQECLSKVNHLLETLERAYPGLPDLENNWNVLEEAWSFLDWSRGVIGG